MRKTINKVANGYLIEPPQEHMGEERRYASAYVFETFGNLVDFLRKTMEDVEKEAKNA